MHIFVADVHLKPGSSRDEAVFLDWIETFGKKALKIFILGDLFEYWYSGIEPKVSNIMDRLSEFDVRILPGNRDFLMQASSLPQIEHVEEIVLELHGRKCLVAHGHTLTTHDRGFRVLHAVGWPLFKYMDSRLSIEAKEKIAGRLIKASSVIRPLQSEIRPGICAEKGVDAVICGHLHRGIMKKDLIVLPPFAGERAWLEVDEKRIFSFARF
jgi:UDP-2,3-diacylglucosamine hydrolase